MPRKRNNRRKQKPKSNAAKWSKLNARLSKEVSTYLVRLTTGPGSFSATAGGVMSGTFLVDPSVTSYTEEKSVQALYSSSRLIASKLFISPETGNITKRSMYFASFLGTGLATPTSYAQVADNAQCLMYTNIANDTTGRPKTLVLYGNKKLGFQEWGTTATDVSGAPGGFYYYGDGMTASQPVMLLNVETIFECRNRV